MNATRLSALAVALLLVLPASLRAQGVDLGGQLVYTPEPAGLEEGAFGVGARLGFGLPLAGVGIHGTFDFFFPECDTGECDLWNGAVNVTVDVSLFDRVTPYGGGGVSFQKLDLEGVTVDDTGFNVLAGLRTAEILPVALLAEVRYQVMNDFDDQVVVALGFLF